MNAYAFLLAIELASDLLICSGLIVMLVLIAMRITGIA